MTGLFQTLIFIGFLFIILFILYSINDDSIVVQFEIAFTGIYIGHRVEIECTNSILLK